MFRRARKLANALAAAGVREGDRVGTLAWNDYRHLELYYAVSCMGAVLHTVNPRLFPEQVEYIINHAEDRLLFIDPTLLPLLAQLAGKLPTVRKAIVLASDAALPAAVAGKLESYEAFIAGQPAEYDWPVLDERAASSLCYTSGTTGNPKGVLFSHRSTVLHAYAGCLPDVLGLSSRETVLAVVPMFHANAWGLPYNGPMVGAKLVFPGPRWAIPRRWSRSIEEEGVTHAAGVPTVWTGLLNYLDQTGKRLPTLKRTLVGGLGRTAQDDPRVRSEARHRRTARLGYDGDEPDRHRQFLPPRGRRTEGGHLAQTHAAGPRRLRCRHEDRR